MIASNDSSFNYCYSVSDDHSILHLKVEKTEVSRSDRWVITKLMNENPTLLQQTQHELRFRRILIDHKGKPLSKSVVMSLEEAKDLAIKNALEAIENHQQSIEELSNKVNTIRGSSNAA